MVAKIKRKLYRYIDTIIPYINQIKEDIANSQDSKARYKIDDIRKIIQFKEIPDINIYLIMKYILNIVGIEVERGCNKEGYGVLIMNKMTESYINQIKEDIANSPDHKARYKIDDIRKTLGPGFEKTDIFDIQIYLIMKSVLNTVGIDVEKGRHKEGYGLLIMNKMTED